MTEERIDKILDVCLEILEVKEWVDWDIMELDDAIFGVFLNPCEAKEYYDDPEATYTIVLNSKHIYNEDEELQVVCSIAHECFHLYQYINRKYIEEFNNYKNFKSDDYLNQQIEIEAYTFQNEFLRFVYGPVTLTVMKSLDEKKVNEALQLIRPMFIQYAYKESKKQGN